MSSRGVLGFLPDVYPSFCSISELWWKRAGAKVVLTHEQMAWHCSWWRAAPWGAFAHSSLFQPLRKAVCAGTISVGWFQTVSVVEPREV